MTGTGSKTQQPQPTQAAAHHSVYLVGGDPRRNGCVCCVQHQAADAAGLPDPSNLLSTAAGHGRLLPALNLRGGHTREVVVGLGDVRGDLRQAGQVAGACMVWPAGAREEGWEPLWWLWQPEARANVPPLRGFSGGAVQHASCAAVQGQLRLPPRLANYLTCPSHPHCSQLLLLSMQCSELLLSHSRLQYS